MRHTPLLIALIVLFTGAASATTPQVMVADVDIPEKINAGSMYLDTVKVQYLGDRKATVEMNLNVTAENTDTEGINFTTYSEEFTMKPNTRKEVITKIETHSGLVPDDFNFSVQAEARIQGKNTGVNNKKNKDQNQDDGGGGGGGYNLGGDEDKNTNQTNNTVTRNMTDGEDNDNKTIDGGEIDNLTEGNESGELPPYLKGKDFITPNDSKTGKDTDTGKTSRAKVLETLGTLIILTALASLLVIAYKIEEIRAWYYGETLVQEAEQQRQDEEEQEEQG